MRIRWRGKARPQQVTPDGNWSTWLILAGRGWGKTRTGAEDAAWYGIMHPSSRIAIVAPTYADARDTCVEGESGLLSVLPHECVQAWNRSLGELVLYNGTRYKLFSAEEPERLRGPQHHRAWCDELGAWTEPETWDQLQFGLRLGEHPQVVVTTTPKPSALVRRLIDDPRTHVTRGSTYENAANLAPAALERLRDRYEGTRVGRQELHAEVLDDFPGALWTLAMLDRCRVNQVPDLTRVVVGIDPSGSDGESGDSQGIVVAGLGVDGRGYVLADQSCRMSPADWGRRAVYAAKTFSADRIVAEANYGGAMVTHVIRTVDPRASVKLVSATRGKAVRAEPVAALYEQGKVSHAGSFPALEDQMRAMTPNGYEGEGSPDRLDALVWTLTELMLAEQRVSISRELLF